MALNHHPRAYHPGHHYLATYYPMTGNHHSLHYVGKLFQHKAADHKDNSLCQRVKAFHKDASSGEPHLQAAAVVDYKAQLTVPWVGGVAPTKAQPDRANNHTGQTA